MICPLCDCSQIKYLALFKPYEDQNWTFDIYDCPSCYSRFTFKNQSIKYHDLLYEKYPQYQRYYKIADKTKKLLNNPKRCKSYLSEIAFSYREILNFIEMNIPTSSSILEIGSSTGFLTAYLRRKGYQAYGIDISTKAILYARKTFGEFYDIQVQSDKFDVIFHVGTIGCIDNPVDFLGKYLTYLNPGGSMIFNAPNYDSLIENDLLWVKTPPPDLLFVFSALTFKKIIKNPSFTITSKKIYQRMPHFLHKSISRNNYPMKFFSTTKQQLKNKTLMFLYKSFNNIINRFELFKAFESDYGLIITIKKHRYHD